MAKDKPIPKEIEVYLMGLLIEKKLDTLPPGMSADLMYDLYLRLDKYLITNLMRALPDQKYHLLDEKMNKDEITSEEVNRYLRENTNYDKVATETLKEFKAIFLSEKEAKTS